MFARPSPVTIATLAQLGSARIRLGGAFAVQNAPLGFCKMFTKSANGLVKLESVQRNARSDSRLGVGAYQLLGGFRLDHPVKDARVTEVNLQLAGPGKRALDQSLGERIFHILLQGPPQ